MAVRAMPLLIALLLACAALSCGPAEAWSEVCSRGYAEPERYAKLQTHRVAEASGIASSRTNQGLLWTHEDKGKDPKVYAVSLRSSPPGAVVATLDLRDLAAGKERPDFEDIAVANCPHQPGDCIWVGDIGDNCARLQSNGRPNTLECNSEHYLYAIPEPVVTSTTASKKKTKPRNAHTIKLRYKNLKRYPDIPMDSEALVVSSDGSMAALVEKRLMQTDPPRSTTPARIFQTSRDLRTLRDGEEVSLDLVSTIDNPDGWRITGADLHPSGRELVVRTSYWGGTYAYSLARPNDLSDLRFQGRVVKNSNNQPQPEAVGYDFTNVDGSQVGKALWHISELPGGYQTIEYVRCRDGAPYPTDESSLSLRSLLP